MEEINDDIEYWFWPVTAPLAWFIYIWLVIGNILMKFPIKKLGRNR